MQTAESNYGTPWIEPGLSRRSRELADELDRLEVQGRNTYLGRNARGIRVYRHPENVEDMDTDILYDCGAPHCRTCAIVGPTMSPIARGVAPTVARDAYEAIIRTRPLRLNEVAYPAPVEQPFTDEAPVARPTAPSWSRMKTRLGGLVTAELKANSKDTRPCDFHACRRFECECTYTGGPF